MQKNYWTRLKKQKQNKTHPYQRISSLGKPVTKNKSLTQNTELTIHILKLENRV